MSFSSALALSLSLAWKILFHRDVQVLILLSAHPEMLYKGGYYKQMQYCMKHILQTAMRLEVKQVQATRSPLCCFGVEQ